MAIDYTSALSWRILRKEIYDRDKQTCWVCGLHVDLKDYDLGHLVDHANGGKNLPSNLAVMHTACNLRKPLHHTLEEVIKWRLSIATSIIPPIHASKRGRQKEHKRSANQDAMAAKELTIEYFTSHPLLLDKEHRHSRSEAIRNLSESLGYDITRIRAWLRESRLVTTKIVIADGSQYIYIWNHLTELFTKYQTLSTFKVNKPKALGLNSYGYSIFLYFAGMTGLVQQSYIYSISKRINQLRALGMLPKTLTDA